MYPPPRKPSWLWSKLSPLNSSITVCDAPDARNGLIQRSLKKTRVPDIVWGQKFLPTTPRPGGGFDGVAIFAISRSLVFDIVKEDSTTTSAGCSYSWPVT